MNKRIRAFLNDESGVTAIEYGILAAAMAAAIGVIFGENGVFISALKERFRAIGGQISNTGGSSQ